jgi:hypothetical protein
MLRVSLRELLLLTAFVAGGLAALKYAGEAVWIVLSSAVPLCLMAATVVALVDRGRRQAMASGFVACMGIYWAMLMLTGSAGRSHWPTEMFIGRLHDAMATRTWVDQRNGKVFNYDPREDGAPNYFRTIESPEAGYFNAIGHFLGAILFGYVGSRFAAWIYMRRAKSEPPT